MILFRPMRLLILALCSTVGNLGNKLFLVLNLVLKIVLKFRNSICMPFQIPKCQKWICMGKIVMEIDFK